MKKLLAVVIVLSIVMLSACSFVKDKPAGTTSPGADDTQSEITKTENIKKDIVLYFATSDALGLGAEVRSVPAEEAGDPDCVLEQLVAGPSKEGLVSVLPEGTKILSCKLSDGLCTVDVSKEFVSGQGSANEQMIIYSVVNTLCRIDGVDEVAFLVEGEKVMIFGSYIFDEPFKEDTTLIKVGY